MIPLYQLPQHIALIMDGNGRWAKSRGLQRIDGHREGARRIEEILELSLELKIPYLTFFAFSQENWQRPSNEVEGLMALLQQFLLERSTDLIQKGVRLKVIGGLHSLPISVQQALKETVHQTQDGKQLTLILALSYSAREEILQAVLRFVDQKKDQPDLPLNCENFSTCLDTAGIPDPDFLIRTSGEQRLSNFLLWQLAYTELYFTPITWPDFKKEEFTKALLEYQKRERRFGMTREQLSSLVRP